MDIIIDIKLKKFMFKIKVKVIIKYVVLCCVVLNINLKKFVWKKLYKFKFIFINLFLYNILKLY